MTRRRPRREDVERRKAIVLRLVKNPEKRRPDAERIMQQLVERIEEQSE